MQWTVDLGGSSNYSNQLLRAEEEEDFIKTLCGYELDDTNEYLLFLICI